MKAFAAITGASSGLGVYLAEAFASEGFDILLCARNSAALREVRTGIEGKHSARCEIVVADLRQPSGQSALADALGKLDVRVFVNNAAINPELTRGLKELPSEDLQNVIATNAFAAIALCRLAYDSFRSRSAGTIVNINSVAGLRGSGHEPGYAASKFALRGFSESVKDAWFASGVRVVDVYAGAIATGMSVGRPDVGQLIDPSEFAELIVRLSRSNSLFVREINVQKAPVRALAPAKVVFANGVFDLLHSGHLALLQYAKSIGDTLVVGINSDRAVRQLKGPSRPIQGEIERKAALEKLGFVDKVVIFDDVRTRDIVRTVNPSVIVKGGEYTAEAIRAADNIPTSIDIVTFPLIVGPNGDKVSTTALVEMLRHKG